MSKKKKNLEAVAAENPPSSPPGTPPPPHPSDEGSDSPDESENSSSLSEKDSYLAPSPNQLKAGSETFLGQEGSPTKEPSEQPRKLVVAGLPAKRRLEAEGVAASRKRFKADTEEGKQQLFQRLYSEEDEIVILKGMIDYSGKYSGADPKAKASDFLEFIKESLSVDVDAKQLLSKIRSLKRRYLNSVVGKKKSTISAHEREALELSRKIWEIDGDETKTVKKQKVKVKVEDDADPDGYNADGGSDGDDGEITGDELWSMGRNCVLMGMDEFVVREGLAFVEESEKIRMSNKWKELHVEEIELLQQKLCLVKETGKLILDALRSSS